MQKAGLCGFELEHDIIEHTRLSGDWHVAVAKRGVTKLAKAGAAFARKRVVVVELKLGTYGEQSSPQVK